MCAHFVKFFILFSLISKLLCVKVTEYQGPDYTCKLKTELKPLYISATIGDIIIISAPVINSNTEYYLSKPNSEVLKVHLNISRTAFHKNTSNHDKYNDIIVNVKGNVKAIITSVNKYKIFNLNHGRNCLDTKDIYKEEEEKLMPNDFMIGPLLEEDHGNWVLSAFYKDTDGEWIEIFQVITVEIIEQMQIYPARPKLELGNDLYLRFEYPIKDLESCEITAPRSTFDRFYGRDGSYTDFCGFSVPNVTKEDQGFWRIVGVGLIVYEANVFVEINVKD